MTQRGRPRRRRMWFMIVTGAAVSGALAGASAWFGRGRRASAPPD